MKKRSQEDRGRAVRGVVVAVIVVGVVIGGIALVLHRDLVEGNLYYSDALRDGLPEAAAERFRLYALACRERGIREPSPVEWAKERFLAGETFAARENSLVWRLQREAWARERDCLREAERSASP